MIKFLMILTAFSTTELHAASIYEQAVCKNQKPGNEVEIYAGSKVYHLDDKNKSCSINYSYIDSGDGSIIILAGPDSEELGINAQNEIYFAPPGRDSATNIGAIPVRSDFIDNKTFRDIAQLGGSLFQTIYKIKEGRLTIIQPSYELIFSDKQCIYNRQESKKCMPLKGTYDKPICVRQFGERKILAQIEKCAELRKEIDFRQGK